MNFAREPRLQPVRIADLRPTQVTVGMREVAAKRAEWRAHAADARPEFLGRHLIPVVLGPGARPYLTDHHHLARALHDEGVEDVAVTVVADLSGLSKDAFWVNMDNRGWTHLYDSEGRKCTHKALPKHVSGLADDPFRSLAGALRRAGGFAKDITPFSEFLWADYLRRQIKLKKLESDPDDALAEALQLAKAAQAGFLPGWCGPSEG